MEIGFDIKSVRENYVAIRSLYGLNLPKDQKFWIRRNGAINLDRSESRREKDAGFAEAKQAGGVALGTFRGVVVIMLSGRVRVMIKDD
jgi:hypothetical protein